MSADRYGQFCFAVETPTHSMNVYADEVQVVRGALLFTRKVDEGTRHTPNLILAPGAWTICYAASLTDGRMVAVDRFSERKPTATSD